MEKKTGFSNGRKIFDSGKKSLLSAQKPRSGLFSNPKRRIPVIFFILIIILFVLILIHPTGPHQFIAVSTSGSFSTISPLPTFTLPAEPTDSHGGRIIFTCTRGGFHQLCMINADGSGLLRLTDHQAHDYYPSFHPLGSAILYASNRQGSFDIYLDLAHGGKTIQLTHSIGNAFAPIFSPGGEKILFINGENEGSTTLWLMESSGKNQSLLFKGDDPIVGADWAPNGQTIAVVVSDKLTGKTAIYLLDTQDNLSMSLQSVFTGIDGITGSLDWSPDGHCLLFCGGNPGDKDIFQIEISTGSIEQLTDGGNNAAASYSPDGLWIVFNSLRNDEQADLYIMQANGTYQRQLTDDPEPDWQPQWEP